MHIFSFTYTFQWRLFNNVGNRLFCRIHHSIYALSLSVEHSLGVTLITSLCVQIKRHLLLVTSISIAFFALIRHFKNVLSLYCGVLRSMVSVFEPSLKDLRCIFDENDRCQEAENPWTITEMPRLAIFIRRGLNLVVKEINILPIKTLVIFLFEIIIYPDLKLEQITPNVHYLRWGQEQHHK